MTNYANLARSTLTNSPTIDGLSITIEVADAALFPTEDFIVTVWDVGVNPTAANAEIIHIASRSSNTLTVSTNGRGYEGSTAAAHTSGDNIALTMTTKALDGDNANMILAGQVFS